MKREKARVKSPNYYLLITNYSRQRRAGFTLMELMIVVSLVGIIVSVGLTNYITQIKRSRDARRKTDLEQIRAALEIYRADHFEYPISSGDVPSVLTPDYINPLPQDPGNFSYYYSSTDGEDYQLCAHLETEATGDLCGNKCGGSCEYVVFNPSYSGPIPTSPPAATPTPTSPPWATPTPTPSGCPAVGRRCSLFNPCPPGCTCVSFRCQ